MELWDNIKKTIGIETNEKNGEDFSELEKNGKDSLYVDTPYAHKKKEMEADHKGKFPWLYNPERGVRWDFDPIYIRELTENNHLVGMLIDAISKEVAKTSWQIVETDGTETQKRSNTNPFDRELAKTCKQSEADEIRKLLKSPNPDTDFTDFINMMMWDLLEVGSTASFLDFPQKALGNNRNGDKVLRSTDYKPLQVRVAPPETMTKSYTEDKNGLLDGFWQYDRRQQQHASSRWTVTDPIFFDENEVVWSDLNPKSNRRYGYPPTLMVRDTLELIDVTVKQEKTYFEKGATPSGILVFEEMDMEEVQAYKEMMSEDVSGKPHKTLAAGGDGGSVDYKQFGYNYRELQFLERQQWYSKIIASAFRVPVSVVGLKPEDVNRATFQGERSNFESNTLGSYLQKIERVINSQIVNRFWGDDYRFEFQPGLSEEQRSRISERVSNEWNAGIINRNEARRQLGYDTLEDDEMGGEFQTQEENDRVGAAEIQLSTTQKQEEPMRETDDWQQFNLQPSEVDEFAEEIRQPLQEVWNDLLSDDEFINLIDQHVNGKEEEEKSSFDIRRKVQELLESIGVVDKLTETVGEGANEKAKESLEEAADETGLDINKELVSGRLAERESQLLENYSQRMVQSITETVSEGWEQGESIDAIKDNLKEKEDDFTDYQARRLARDQLQRATGEARNEFAKQHSDKFVEVWISSGDDRVRPAHEAMDGKWKRPSEEFAVPYERAGSDVEEDYPGDSKYGIQCRCDTLLKPKSEVDLDDHAGV